MQIDLCFVKSFVTPGHQSWRLMHKNFKFILRSHQIECKKWAILKEVSACGLWNNFLVVAPAFEGSVWYTEGRCRQPPHSKARHGRRATAAAAAAVTTVVSSFFAFFYNNTKKMIKHKFSLICILHLNAHTASWEFGSGIVALGGVRTVCQDIFDACLQHRI